MEICNKLRRDLAMFAYIYLNVDECWLTPPIAQQRFKLQILLNYAAIPENVEYLFWATSLLRNIYLQKHREVVVSLQLCQVKGQ